MKRLGRRAGGVVLVLVAFLLVASPVRADNCTADTLGADAPSGQDGDCGDSAAAAGWLAGLLGGLAGWGLAFGGGGGGWPKGADRSALKETFREFHRENRENPTWGEKVERAFDRFAGKFLEGFAEGGSRAYDFGTVLFFGPDANVQGSSGSAGDRILESYKDPFYYRQLGRTSLATSGKA